MNVEIFVENIKFYCDLRNIRTTSACAESGVGKSFISDLNRGRVPSVEKVQMLAQYLGVTVSQLLGEESPPGAGAGVSPADQALLNAYHRANAHTQQLVTLALEPFKEKGTTTAETAG